MRTCRPGTPSPGSAVNKGAEPGLGDPRETIPGQETIR